MDSLQSASILRILETLNNNEKSDLFICCHQNRMRYIICSLLNNTVPEICETEILNEGSGNLWLMLKSEAQSSSDNLSGKTPINMDIVSRYRFMNVALLSLKFVDNGKEGDKYSFTVDINLDFKGMLTNYELKTIQKKKKKILKDKNKYWTNKKKDIKVGRVLFEPLKIKYLSTKRLLFDKNSTKGNQKTVYLLRHGNAYHNYLKAISKKKTMKFVWLQSKKQLDPKVYDSPLSDEGIQQSLFIRDYLINQGKLNNIIKNCSFITSDLRRTQQTIILSLGLQPKHNEVYVIPFLHEFLFKFKEDQLIRTGKKGPLFKRKKGNLSTEVRLVKEQSSKIRDKYQKNKLKNKEYIEVFNDLPDKTYYQGFENFYYSHVQQLKKLVHPRRIKSGFRFPLNLSLYKKILDSLGGSKKLNTILNGKRGISEFLELIHFLLKEEITKQPKKKTKKKTKRESKKKTKRESKKKTKRK